MDCAPLHYVLKPVEKPISNYFNMGGHIISAYRCENYEVMGLNLPQLDDI